jgi:hypothetical protein
MKRAGPKVFCLAAVLALFFCASVRAQVPTNPPPNVSTSSVPTRLLPRPVLKSPVALFRELLAMNLMEQMQFLTNRSPEDRKLILAKVREYKSLKPDQRELRLRVTELRWYLLPLMRSPSTNRLARLNMIPPEQRELVEARLKEWDKLPPELQKELLENEAAISCLTELEINKRPVAGISPERQHKLEDGIRQWQGLSEEQRDKIMTRFNQFFELRPREKEKALSTMSEPERRQIEKTLHKFDDLSPVKRSLCIRSFEKFANLSVEERQQFLKNADRWKLMTPEERQSWRDLVAKISISPLSSSLLFKPPRPAPPPLQTPAVAATNGQ